MDQEFWEGEDLYYECIDTSLGVDANSSNFKMYKCIADKPIGRYNTPRVNHSYEEWPICQPKTTTVKPGIVEMGLNLFTLYSLKFFSKKKYFWQKYFWKICQNGPKILIHRCFVE